MEPPKNTPVPATGDCNLDSYPVSKSAHDMILDAQKNATATGDGLLVKVVIDEKGNITHLRILRLAFPTAPNTVALNEQAIDSVKKWHYKPTIFKGEPVSVCTEMAVNIDLQ